MVAVTDYHKQGGLKQQKWKNLGGRQSEIKALPGLAFPTDVPLLSFPASGWLRQSLAYDCLTLLCFVGTWPFFSLFQVSFYLSLSLSSLAALTSFSCVLEWNPGPCTGQARALPLSPISFSSKESVCPVK